MRERTRAAPEATDPDPTQEPLTPAKIGGPIVRLHAAEALLQRAGQALDVASADPSPRRIAEGGIATAEAKIASAELPLDASTTLIELAGTHSTRNAHNLDRH